MITYVTLYFKKRYPYLLNGYKEVYSDLGLFVTDFFIASVVPYLVQIILWSNIYHGTTGMHNGYGFTSILLYYAYSISLNRLNNGYENIEKLSILVHLGQLDIYRCKPLSFVEQRLFSFIGGSLPYAMLFYGVFFSINLFSFISLNALSLNFIISLIILPLALGLCFYTSMFFALFTFVTVKPDFLLSLLLFLQTVFGGVLLPYNFWPDWCRPLMHYNPFWFIIAGPTELFLNYSSTKFVTYVISSVLYVIFFALIINICFKRLPKLALNMGG